MKVVFHWSDGIFNETLELILSFVAKDIADGAVLVLLSYPDLRCRLEMSDFDQFFG
jgi:hypothetical protein